MTLDFNDPQFSLSSALPLVMKKVLYKATMKAKQTNTALVIARDGVVQEIYGNDIDSLLITLLDNNPN